MQSAVFLSAVSEDRGQVMMLLREAGLPLPDDRDAPTRFLLGREGDRTLACTGWERYGPRALMRSTVVCEAARGQGLGSAMVEALAMRLRREGVSEVYLLTTTAQDFFVKHGFSQVSRCSVPADVLCSREFADRACEAAVCMRRRL